MCLMVLWKNDGYTQMNKNNNFTLYYNLVHQFFLILCTYKSILIELLGIPLFDNCIF